MEHEGSCYKAYETGLTWQDAERACVVKRGHLVTISNSSENDFVSKIAPLSAGTPIGLRHPGNATGFTWSDGNIQGQVGYNYSNWGNGQPRLGQPGEVLCVSLEHGKWQIQNCHKPRKYVCEAGDNKKLK